MDSVRKFPDRKAVEAEACAWIAQFDGGKPSPQDLHAFHQWLDSSPLHRQEMKRLSALWRNMDSLRSLAAPPARRERRGGRLVAAAAVLVVVALAGAMTARQWHSAAGADQRATYATAIGEHQTVTLADGSHVTLDTNSIVQVDFNADSRRLRLMQGQALFAVTKNPRRPFLVYAGTGRVRAVGTEFSVHLQDREHVEVVVAEGIVDLASTPGGVPANGAADPPAPVLARIKAGQGATFGQHIESMRSLAAAEIDRELAWRDGMLRFDGQPLSEVVHELARYTSQTIVIRDPAIGDLRVAGYFKAGETEGIYDALEKSFDLRVERAGPNLIYLSAGPAK